MARPSNYSEEVVEKITSALEAGNTRKAASQFGGISDDTFGRWLKRYADFAAAVARAEARWEVRCVSLIQKAASEREVVVKKIKTLPGGVTIEEVRISREIDWQAAAWLLERRRPEDWQRRDKVDVDASMNTAGEIVGIAKALAKRAAKNTGEEEGSD